MREGAHSTDPKKDKFPSVADDKMSRSLALQFHCCGASRRAVGRSDGEWNLDRTHWPSDQEGESLNKDPTQDLRGALPRGLNRVAGRGPGCRGADGDGSALAGGSVFGAVPRGSRLLCGEDSSRTDVSSLSKTIQCELC